VAIFGGLDESTRPASKVVEAQKNAPKKVVKTQPDTIFVDPPQKLYVIPAKLNMRVGPGTNHKVTKTISGGPEFYVKGIAVYGDWAKLKRTWWHLGGWVCRKYLGSKEVAAAAEQKRNAAEQRHRQTQDEWLSAGMRIYPGVKIYYGDGPQKRYVGTVIETGQIDGKRAVLLEPGGWKYRNSLIQWGWVLRSQYEEAKRRYLGE